jgi:hypothetical protein
MNSFDGMKRFSIQYGSGRNCAETDASGVRWSVKYTHLSATGMLTKSVVSVFMSSLLHCDSNFHVS